jgi:hypothetical protein
MNINELLKSDESEIIEFKKSNDAWNEKVNSIFELANTRDVYFSFTAVNKDTLTSEHFNPLLFKIFLCVLS